VGGGRGGGREGKRVNECERVSKRERAGKRSRCGVLTKGVSLSGLLLSRTGLSGAFRGKKEDQGSSAEGIFRIIALWLPPLLSLSAHSLVPSFSKVTGFQKVFSFCRWRTQGVHEKERSQEDENSCVLHQMLKRARRANGMGARERMSEKAGVL
jgi:hypothetical protein